MTHIGHSGKVLFMRIFIAALVLIFSLQSWTKADDISDFEIEGMSIGDSLLKFYSETKIKNQLSDNLSLPVLNPVQDGVSKFVDKIQKTLL